MYQLAVIRIRRRRQPRRRVVHHPRLHEPERHQLQCRRHRQCRERGRRRVQVPDRRLHRRDRAELQPRRHQRRREVHRAQVWLHGLDGVQLRRRRQLEQHDAVQRRRGVRLRGARPRLHGRQRVQLLLGGHRLERERTTCRSPDRPVGHAVDLRRQPHPGHRPDVVRVLRRRRRRRRRAHRPRRRRRWSAARRERHQLQRRRHRQRRLVHLPDLRLHELDGE